MKKLPEDELLRLACIYAESDREALVAAYEHMPRDPERKRAERFLKQLRAYRLKRWGQTNLEATMEKMRPVSVADVMGRPNE